MQSTAIAAAWRLVIRRPETAGESQIPDCLAGRYPISTSFDATLTAFGLVGSNAGGFGYRPGDNMISGSGIVPEASFSDTTDLGRGRKVGCKEVLGASGTTVRTLCWASSHLGSPSRDWTAVANESAEGIRDSLGAIAGLLGSTSQFVNYKTYGDGFEIDETSKLDSQGPKFAPHACLACHGGRFDPGTGGVVGASFLPLEPNKLVFPSKAGFSRAEQEETIRHINAVIYRSTANPTIREYIQAMYGGKVETAGAKALDEFTPPGWAEQAGLYRQVYRPYCATCHNAQLGDLAFASWGAMLRKKDDVKRAVCNLSMPHAELPYVAFHDDRGGVSKKGLLLASLGFQGC